MNHLNYLTNHDSSLQAKLDELGCDIDTLVMISEPVFRLLDQAQSSPREVAEVLYRLRLVHTQRRGEAVEVEAQVYENSRMHPTRVAVFDAMSGQTVCFNKLHGESGKFQCEICNEVVRRTTVKSHAVSNHATSR